MRAQPKSSPGAVGSAEALLSRATFVRGAVGCMAVVLGVLLSAASASAAFTHPLITTFGTFTHPSGISVDESSATTKGNVLVADGSGSNSVDIFGPQGEAPSHVKSPFKIEGFAFNNEPSGVAIDNSSTSASKGDLYVADVQHNAVKKFKLNPLTEEYEFVESLIASGGFGEPLGVAVDANGRVYVANYSPSSIIEFNPAGTETGRIVRGGSPSSLAFDSAGDLFVQNYSGGAVFKLTLDGSGAVTQEQEVVGGGATGIAVDPGADALYVGFGSHISEYRPATGMPVLEGDFSGNGELGSISRLTVNAETHKIYATDQGTGHVALFGPGAIIPDVALGPLTQNQTTGIFTGQVGLAGGPEITSCHFQYVTEEAFNATGFSDLSSGGDLTCEPPAPITSDREVTAHVSGLVSDKPYVYRLAAGNANGTNFTARASFTPRAVSSLKTEAATNVTASSAQFHGSFVGNEQDTNYYFEWGTDQSYGTKTPIFPADAGSPAGPARTTVVPVTLPDHTLSPATEYHFRIVASNLGGTSYGEDLTFTTTPAVAELQTKPATNFTPTSAQLNGTFVGNGEPTHYYFEWGVAGYEHTTPVPPGELVPGGTTLVPASVHLTGLLSLTPYNFRIVASNGEGTTFGNNEVFELPLLPVINESVSGVHSDDSVIHAQINPGGGDTHYRFEYATEEEFEASGYGHSEPVPDADIGSGLTAVGVSLQLGGLQPGTTYHWRAVATNPSGTVEGPDRLFTTYPFTPFEDTCPNAHVRQQTGSAQLLDCRAYELVSAANSGGYNVESNLVPGQTPYPDYPEAGDRVLYGVHDGGIPGTGHPTNRGVDPYVATRGEGGWSTEYLGVPADNPFASGPFSSSPSGVSANISTLAFGGPGGCSPCFEGGYTGIPVHLANGELAQGMTPSSAVAPAPPPSAVPDGYIAKDLSADGSHFVFGSTSKFAEGGNSGTGDVSIYDRDMKTRETHVVSNTPGGTPLACLQGAGSCHSPGDGNGIAELDISSDGSRILVAQKVSTDADGNNYWHLYMDVNDASDTIDVTPGAIDGVLYDGMSSDGSEVFFTTKDKLSSDTDTSADIYEAQVSGSGVTITRVSTGPGGPGGVGDTSSCEPVSNSAGEHWNTVGSAKNCDAVAIGGAGGVSPDGGSVYFLSPELLEAGQGTQNQPNLYLVHPGSAPHFVATLSPEDPVVVDAIKAAGTRKTEDFQLTPSGDFSTFNSTLPLPPSTQYDNAGHSEIYLYRASTDTLECASCDPTGVEPSFDSSLASDGLSLTDDGRVFFTTSEPLVARDLDEKGDVYEWEAQGTVQAPGKSCQTNGGCIELISTGASPFASGLLGVSANGTNAYFFTRDTLVPQDQNGSLTKVYDARELGGFLFIPASPPCAASDECHGPSSQAPGSPQIRTIAGGPGNVEEEPKPKRCRPGFVRRHGKCVKRKHTHHKRSARRG